MEVNKLYKIIKDRVYIALLCFVLILGFSAIKIFTDKTVYRGEISIEIGLVVFNKGFTFNGNLKNFVISEMIESLNDLKEFVKKKLEGKYGEEVSLLIAPSWDSSKIITVGAESTNREKVVFALEDVKKEIFKRHEVKVDFLKKQGAEVRNSELLSDIKISSENHLKMRNGKMIIAILLSTIISIIIASVIHYLMLMIRRK